MPSKNNFIDQKSCFQALSEEMQELADMLHATCVEETGTKDGNLRKYDYINKIIFACV